MISLPERALEVLREGRLCYLAASTRAGMHVTPVVFAFEDGRVWVTTRRGAVKARAWRRQPATAGLVRHGGLAVSFRGAVTLYDLLDPSTWPAGLRRAPSVLRASARFTIKNAPYFAGYARDARRVPLSWTPPARVMASVELEAAALLDIEEGSVAASEGAWPGGIRGPAAFAPLGRRAAADRDVPPDLRDAFGRSGEGALALGGVAGPAILPARWVRSGTEGAYYAAAPRAFIALSGAGGSAPGAIVVDRASRWRASGMRGLLLQGDAEVFDPSDLTSGAEELRARLRRTGPVGDVAGVRLIPQRVVWWRGWTSGTVGRP